MRKLGKIFYCVLCLIIVGSCNQKETATGVQIKKLDYPSASSVDYFNGQLYVMGDDATNLIVLDTNLNIIDSIQIFSYPDRRIPKNRKLDPEGSALSTDSTGTSLFLFGSGSLSPYRDSVITYHLESKNISKASLDSLYSQIKGAGIEQINMEGACMFAGQLLLVNRGNKSYPKNHLVIADKYFHNNSGTFQIEVIPPGPTDTGFFRGISGMCYSKQNDQLIMTVSTEDTRSAYEDGAIGKSYLWVVNDISGKLKNKTVGPDRVIDLDEIDPRLKKQKVESATIIYETPSFYRLVVVVDNDDGSSTIFKTSLPKN